MHRFFVDPAQIQRGVVYFDSEVSHQIAKVLRLQSGSKVIALDNNGIEYQAKLEVVDSKRCTAQVLETHPCQNEPKVFLEMQLCLTQREKFEWMLQKCTEIGAGSFTPVISSRTLIQQTDEVREKYPRWQKIIREAAEQSGRGRIPVLNPTVRITDLILNKISNVLYLIAWEEEQKVSLRTALDNYSGRAIAMLIGPEGGFSIGETEQVIAGGYTAVSLGRRILRMETAAITAAAVILYKLDEE